MDRVSDPADPSRCKMSVGREQCDRVAATGSDFCVKHGGIDRSNEQSTRMYLLAEADQGRVNQLADHEAIRSLREEIAIARRLLERRWNLMKSDQDLLMGCGAINSLLMTIGKLVKEAHTIEQNLDVLLSKATVFILAQSVARIISEELRGIEGYEDICDRINLRIVETIAAAKNNRVQHGEELDSRRNSTPRLTLQSGKSSGANGD